MKYTIEQIKNEKISVICLNREEANTLVKSFGFNKEWYPQNNSEQYEILYDAHNKEFPFIWVTYNQESFMIKKRGATKRIFFKDIIFDEVKKTNKYKLIKDYPSRRIGDLCRYQPQLCELNFTWDSDNQTIPKEFQPDITPEWFSPVYGKEDVVLNIADTTITINEKIVAEGKVIPLEGLNNLIESSVKVKFSGSFEGWKCNSVSEITKYHIGCKTFTVEELKQIVKAYKEWNK